MIEETNGNTLMSAKSSNNTLVTSPSNDDLSQSLSISEYTDADESMSAPTEFLAEFLSAVMLKDYKKALKYCKLILEFEPNNITAKEFHPLILEKLKFESQKSSSDSDDPEPEPYHNASSPEPGDGGTDTGDNSSNEAESDYSSSSDADEKDIISNSNHSNSTSENTTHSYSSSLLEEEDDLHPLPMSSRLIRSPSLSDLNNGNYKSNSCSDSESPTEPLTQQITSILRANISSPLET